jgi:23S rRNA pseudouridine2457 synthase
MATTIDAPDWLPERNPPIRFRKNKPTSWISLQITEGKNRQVRKMSAAVGFPTLRLVRVAIGNLHLKGIQPGFVRVLNHHEIKNLLSD